MGLRSYKEMTVWQKSFQLAEEVYRLTSLFPREELYGLTSQMRRAAIAIPSNVAEGYSRNSRKEYLHFIEIAFSSGAELETQLLLSESLNLAQSEEFTYSKRLLDEVMRMLNTLQQKLRNE